MISRFRSVAISLIGIVLLAINLRPVITTVGPVIGEIGADLSLSSFELGLLGALPIAVFGAVSGFVQALISRFGVERVTLGAMLLLTVATVLRSWPGPDANLWVGTSLIGAAIAVGNVTVPVFVKRSFPARTALVTALYVATLGVCAGVAAAVAVPIAEASPWGWRMSVGVWALLAAIAVVFWGWQSLKHRPVTGGRSVPITATKVNIWRSSVAWQLSLYMGLQSGLFYVSITWLPLTEQHLGFSPVVAGWHMLVLQITAVVGNLLTPVFMKIGPDERFATVLPGVLSLIGAVGMFLAPPAAILWISFLGVGTGVAFVVTLSLMAARAANIQVAGQLSSMSQSIGYVISAAILFTAGSLTSVDPVAVLGVLAVASVGVAGAGLLAGRRRLIGA